MSTAFFHGFDEEYPGGLDLSSDVFDQLFIDALARRARGNTDNNTGDDGVTSSTGLDELTGSSLGEIDNHALLADNIGVDIVGRSNGHEVERRAMAPTPNYLSPPVAVESVRNPSPVGEMQSKSLDSFLAMASNSMMTMGGGVSPLGHSSPALQCAQQQQQQQQAPHPYPMSLHHRSFCPDTPHLGAMPPSNGMHFQFPTVISPPLAPTSVSFSQHSTEYLHTFQTNSSQIQYCSPSGTPAGAGGAAPMSSSMRTGPPHTGAPHSKDYHGPAAAMLPGVGASGGAGHDYMRPAALPPSPRPLVGRVASRTPATVGSFAPLSTVTEHSRSGASRMSGLSSTSGFISPLQHGTPTKASPKGTSSPASLSSVRPSPASIGNSSVAPASLRSMAAGAAPTLSPPVPLLVGGAAAVTTPGGAAHPSSGGDLYTTTATTTTLPQQQCQPPPMRSILLQDPSKTVKRKRKRVRTKAALSAVSPAGDSGSASATSPKSVKGGWPKGKPRTRRESGEPRPVLSSWQFFISAQYKTMDRGKETQLTKNMKQLAAKWQALSEEEKKVYEGKAADDKKRYLAELKEFQSTDSYSDVLAEKVKEHFGTGSAADTIDAEVVDALKSTAEVENSKDLYCSLCQQLFTTQHNHHEHLLGKKHMQNVRKNITSKPMPSSTLPTQPCCPDELSLGHKADIYIENFFDDNRLRELEMQELKTRQIVSQMRLKRHQDTISTLETQKALLQHRSTTLGEHRSAVQAQFDGLHASIRSFIDWEPAAKRCSPMRPVTGIAGPSMSDAAAALGFPASPSTPLSHSHMKEAMLQTVGGGVIPSLPSPPDSSSSTCSAGSNPEASSGVSLAALCNPACSAVPSSTCYGAAAAAASSPGCATTIAAASMCSSPQRLQRPAAAPVTMEWMEIPPGSHRITGSTVLAPLRKPSPVPPTHGHAPLTSAAATQHNAGQWRMSHTSSSSMLSSSIMHLNTSSSGDPGMHRMAVANSAAAAGSTADVMLPHGNHGSHGSTPGLSANNMLSWNEWLTSADLNVSSCP